jgi:hypothetical protein
MNNVNYNNKKLELEKILDNTKITDINLKYDPMKDIKPNKNLENCEANEKQIFQFMDKYFQLDPIDFNELYPHENQPVKQVNEKINILNSDDSQIVEEKSIYIEKHKRTFVKDNLEKMDLDNVRGGIQIEETLYSDEQLPKDISNKIFVDKETKFKKHTKKSNIRKVSREEIN